MRRYESIIIIDSDLSEEGCAKIFEKVSLQIKQSNGLLIEIDDWGIKKLAYEIKKKLRGHYVRFDFCSKTSLINEMEDFYKINDNIIKYMTIVLDKKIDITSIKEMINQNKQDKEQINVEKKTDSLKVESVEKNRSKLWL